MRFRYFIYSATLLSAEGVGLYFIGSWAYVSAMNYYGYCTLDEDNYGRKLSTAERLEIAIADYFPRQISIDDRELGRTLKGRDQGWHIVPYASINEFRLLNENCCNIVWGGYELKQFGFKERADGAGLGMFDFKHLIRYKAPDGSTKEILTEKTYYTVNNCGVPHRLSYL